MPPARRAEDQADRERPDRRERRPLRVGRVGRIACLPIYAPLNRTEHERTASRPKNWLVESILVTIFCCLPFGIVGIINAANVNSRYDTGDFAGATRPARRPASGPRSASGWAWASELLFFIFYVLMIFVIIVGAAAAGGRWRLLRRAMRTCALPWIGAAAGAHLGGLPVPVRPRERAAHFLPCPFHWLTNLYCPGCGAQRAMHDLLHGRFGEAFGHNAALVCRPAPASACNGARPAAGRSGGPWYATTIIVVWPGAWRWWPGAWSATCPAWRCWPPDAAYFRRTDILRRRGPVRTDHRPTAPWRDAHARARQRADARARHRGHQLPPLPGAHLPDPAQHARRTPGWSTRWR